MTRHHDDGDVNVRFGQLSLEVEAAHSGQPDIEHKAARRLRELVLQEFRRRAEQSGLKPNRSKQAAQRLANFMVVIDDEDDWRFGERVNLSWTAFAASREIPPAGKLAAWMAAPPVCRTAVRLGFDDQAAIESPIPMLPGLRLEDDIEPRGSRLHWRQFAGVSATDRRSWRHASVTPSRSLFEYPD